MNRQQPSDTKNGKFSVFRKPFSNSHKIATMFFDEPAHHLYLGFTDGEVECFVPNFTCDATIIKEPKLISLEEELEQINSEIDRVIEEKIRLGERILNEEEDDILIIKE